MARVTVEDCLQHVANRFELIMLATRRTRQLLDGATPLVRAKNKMPIMALREIAAGKVHFEHPAPTAAPAVQPGSKKGEDKA